MKTILETCLPKSGIIQGSFNPEVFTAALGPVIDFYRGKTTGIDRVYTDVEAFFRDATFPTDGLRMTLNNIFRRISGDPTAPSVQRMETAFGGGKTHTLIAAVHIASKGKDIQALVQDIVPAEYLPEPGSVQVVGIAGDELDLSKTRGADIVPYTLWGELARQVGGEELYQKVRAEAENYAAPGQSYFETVLAGKKALLMFDELAQYAARLETYLPGRGGEQVASFLMALIGYARKNTGIALVVTLAGATDAFAKQTEKLGKAVNAISQSDISSDQAVAVAEQASKGISSVISRDATVVTPVQASEISAVLAKRLFEKVDPAAAKDAAAAYCAVYERNKSMLPEEATSINFQERLVSHYPFHPTLIDFLNNKLAQAENFQGTRGVLRVLAMTIRSIWQQKKPIAMIHAADIDMRNSSLVDEILGKTGSSDLRQVLNADVGSVDTMHMTGGESNAQREDKHNPHPEGVKLYEETWKTVFLHSLVGRAESLSSKVFGLTEQEAVFQVASPLVSPSQVKAALEKISQSAFYLRYEKGKYFAHLEPTINSVLARIRSTISDKQIEQKIIAVASSLIMENSIFRVIHNVLGPEDVDDKSEKPVVAVIGIKAKEIDISEMYQYTGNRMIRTRQNLLLLLAPKTVSVKGFEAVSELFGTDNDNSGEAADVEMKARQVLAFKALEEDPLSYGITIEKLQASDFRSRSAEENLALRIRVSSLYNVLYYAGPMGIAKGEIHSAAGDAGESIMNQIQKILIDVNELLTIKDKYGGSMLKQLSSEYFFKRNDRIKCNELLQQFYNLRTWPLLAEKNVLDRILREGVEAGVWIVYRLSNDPADTRPAEIYSDKAPVPMDVSLLGGNSNLSVMSYAGAKARGWLEDDKPSNEQIKKVLKDELMRGGSSTVGDLVKSVAFSLPKADVEQVHENIADIITSGPYAAYTGKVEQEDRPDELLEGISACNHALAEDDVIITKSTAIERGWYESGSNVLIITDNSETKKVFDILGRIGSMYTRGGATSRVTELDISGLKLPGGGSIRVGLDNAEAIDFKRLQEFFQDLHSIVRVTKDSEIELKIDNPDENCSLVKALRQ